MRRCALAVLCACSLSWPAVQAQGPAQCSTDFCRLLREVVDARNTEFKALRGEKRKNDFYFWESDQYDATKPLPGLSFCTVYRARQLDAAVYGCAMIIPAEGADERVEAVAAQAALAVPGWTKLNYQDPDGFKSVRFGPAGSSGGQVIVEYIPREGENLLMLVEVLSR